MQASGWWSGHSDPTATSPVPPAATALNGRTHQSAVHSAPSGQPCPSNAAWSGTTSWVTAAADRGSAGAPEAQRKSQPFSQGTSRPASETRAPPPRGTGRLARFAGGGGRSRVRGELARGLPAEQRRAHGECGQRCDGDEREEAAPRCRHGSRPHQSTPRGRAAQSWTRRLRAGRPAGSSLHRERRRDWAPISTGVRRSGPVPNLQRTQPSATASLCGAAGSGVTSRRPIGTCDARSMRPVPAQYKGTCLWDGPCPNASVVWATHRTGLGPKIEPSAPAVRLKDMLGAGWLEGRIAVEACDERRAARCRPSW